MAIQLKQSFLFALVVVCFAGTSSAQQIAPGARVLLDAHNCYPYEGQWADRIERALSTGMPLAMEPDLDWVDGKSIVAHGRPYTGDEPTLEEYFLSRIAPTLREALKSRSHDDWPLVTLNVDFKNSSAEHCRVIRDVLLRYEDILTTAVKTESITDVSPLDVRPLLVLAAGRGGQYQVFYEDAPVGGKILLFGDARPSMKVPRGISGEERAEFVATVPAEEFLTQPADNFRRWWNNSWHVVEAGGAPRAGDWTPGDDKRLRSLVDRGHELGYLVRFYTLDGFDPQENQGWSAGYNFGSREAAEVRWRAAIAAGVDFVATDMYEAFEGVLTETRNQGRTER